MDERPLLSDKKAWHQVDLVAEAPGSSHLKPQGGSRESQLGLGLGFETSKLTSSNTLPLARSYLLNLPKWLPTGGLSIHTPKNMEGISFKPPQGRTTTEESYMQLLGEYKLQFPK